jgi:hypothetical protein
MLKRLRIKNLSKNQLKIIGFIILLLTLPIILSTLYFIQDTRSRAALPDQLESESGVLSSSGVTKQTSTQASGGQYVKFARSMSSPTPTPSNKTYGTGIAIDSKYNIRIGDRNNNKLSHRFRAKTSSRAVSVTWETRRGDGYSMGDGGTFKISIQTDDGTTNHYPSGKILDSVTFNPTNSGSGNSRNFFPNKPLLTEGQIYHVVWENIHPYYETNYISVNDVWSANDYSRNPDFIGDYAVIVNANGSWGYKAEETYDKFTAVMDLAYENGLHEGQTYMQAFYESGSSDTEIVGRIEGSRQARELFTVQGGNKTVTAASVRAGREYGSDPLTIALKNSSGSTLGSGTVPASAVGFFDNYIADRSKSRDNGDWVTVNFNSPITLNEGSTYQLVMTAPSGTRYNMTPIRYEGRDDIELESWAFREGRAQLSRDGGKNWEDNYNFQPYSNYQFYLSLK